MLNADENSESNADPPETKMLREGWKTIPAFTAGQLNSIRQKKKSPLDMYFFHAATIDALWRQLRGNNLS
jgi:hypothetical protein